MSVLDDSVRLGPYRLIVRDPSLAGKTELIERIARNSVGVLILGETGTGKEVFARTLHALSRRPGELLAINCAALTGALLESELFGHERGAFTGATRTKPGLLEVAGHGTVLLDEIGDLPLELQGKLLRALEVRQVYRVGGGEPVDLCARMIAASHRTVPDLIARGEFREDLYYRLSGITLELLPLRERRGQIPALVDELLVEATREAGRTPHVTAAALSALTAYDWPGNVRELRLVISRALLLAGNGAIEAWHVLLEAARDGLTRDGFLAVAREHRGNASAIARSLHTSRTHVRRLAGRFEVDLIALRR